MALVDDLKAAKALIADPKNWRRGGWGRPGNRCALGTLLDLGCGVGNVPSHPVTKALRRCLPGNFLGMGSVVRFNDDPTTTHADIMALFDRAIAAAEAAK